MGQLNIPVGFMGAQFQPLIAVKRNSVTWLVYREEPCLRSQSTGTGY